MSSRAGILERLAAWDDWALGLREASSQPEALEAWDPLARRELERGRLENWLSSLRRGAAADSAARGRLLRLLGQDEGARIALEAAAGRRAAPEHARLWLAEVLVEDEPERALRLLAPLKYPAAALLRGLCRLRLRRRLAAADDFAEAQAGLKRPFPAALLRGLALHRAGRPLEALAAYGSAPDEAAARHWLAAYASHDAGDPAGAKRSVRAAMGRYSEFELDRFLGLPRREVLNPSPRALSRLDRDAARGPYRVFALALRGMLWAGPRFARYPDSAADFRAALKLEPDAPWLHAYLGRALGNLGERAAARESLDRAVVLAPDSGWIRAWRGCFRYRLGERAAIADLDLAVTLAPAYGFARAWRGGALRLLGRYEEAGAELELAARLVPIYEWSHGELFQVRRAQGRFRAAARCLTEAFEREPKFVWRSRQGAGGSDLAELEAARRAAPRDPLLGAWLAVTRLDQGDTGGASRALGAGARARPAIAEFARGRIEAARGRPGPALAALSRAVELKPAAPYLRARGELLWTLGRLSAAARDLERAVAANGTVAAALWLLAAARLEQGRARPALALLERALGLHPDYHEALALRAEALRRLGRVQEARREARRARELRPDGPWALAALARLSGDPVEASGLWRAALERRAELPPRLKRAWSRESRRTLLRASRLVRPFLSGGGGAAALKRLRRKSPSFWSALIRPAQGVGRRRAG